MAVGRIDDQVAVRQRDAQQEVAGERHAARRHADLLGEPPYSTDSEIGIPRRRFSTAFRWLLSGS